MKILLLQPSSKNILRTHVSKAVESRSGVLPPLGLLYIASPLALRGHSVEILDADAEELEGEGLAARIRAIKPGIVGITVTSFTLLDALYAAQAVKDIDRGIIVVFGGPHCSIYPNETIALPPVDYLILGEGERSFPLLIEALEEKKDLSALRGLVYKSGTQARINHPCEAILSLDELPFPDRTLLPKEKYYSILSKAASITTMVTSRGCPFNCIYCYHHTGRNFRAMSPQRVVDEMALCKAQGFDEIFMIDDTFTVDKKRVMEICRLLRERKLRIDWDARAHVNTIDPEMITAMKEAGCTRLHIGIEAGTDEISKVLRNNIDFKKAAALFSFIRSSGMESLAYFMIGSPSETKEQILSTIDFAVKLNPDFAQFSITTPFPATDLYERGIASGLYKNDYWKEFAARPAAGFTPRYWTEVLSDEELRVLAVLAHKKFYGRPSYMLRSLLKIRSLAELKRKSLGGLHILFHKE